MLSMTMAVITAIPGIVLGMTLVGCISVKNVDDPRALAKSPKLALVADALRQFHQQFPPRARSAEVHYFVTLNPDFDIDAFAARLPNGRSNRSSATYELIWSAKSLEQTDEAFVVRFESHRGRIRRTLITKLVWDGHQWQPLPFSDDGAIGARSK